MTDPVQAANGVAGSVRWFAYVIDARPDEMGRAAVPGI